MPLVFCACSPLGSAKDNGSPINGLPVLLHPFNQSLYLLTLDVFWLFHKKKNCGQMVLALASDQRTSEPARYLLHIRVVIQKHGRKLADLQNFCISASFLSILPKLTQNVMELSRIFLSRRKVKQKVVYYMLSLRICITSSRVSLW